MTNRGTFARVRQSALQGTALAMLGVGGPALVQTLPQSYNSNIPTQTSGNASFQFGSANETIFVNSTTAVLDWTPTDTNASGAPINFQNAATSMTYQGINSAANGYTILNRIVPVGNAAGRSVQFNGTVNSLIANNAVGGTVWFYSPNGIVLGATSQFNIGNLLLTARDPIGGGTTITNPNSFAGGGTGEAGIIVNPGAQINALAEGSYVGLVAPRVIMDGAIRTNGQTALVAAEQAQLTINNGLFNIVIAVGSDSNSTLPLWVQGSIGGPASTGAADPHAIYLVTVPKNVATTALIQGTGSIGFDVATQANISNGRVILSNGYNIAAGQDGALSTATQAVGDVQLTGAIYTSDVIGYATRNAYAINSTPVATTPQFNRSLTLSGLANAHVRSGQNNVNLVIGGDLSLTSGGSQAFQVVNGVQVLTATGGVALAYTETGGRLTIGGNVTMNASVVAPASTGLVAARGGTARIVSNGGPISIAGTTSLSANAAGNVVPVPNRAGATLTGGFVDIIGNTGDITFGNNVTLTAGASGTTSASVTGVTATGGQMLVQTGTSATAGRISVQGSLQATVNAVGDSSTQAGGTSGSAVAGNVSVQTRGAALSVSGQLGLYGGGTGGGGQAVAGTAGGNATGGIMQVLIDGGVSTVGSLTIGAGAAGGANLGGGSGIGGTGTGGTAALVATTGSLTVNGVTDIFANASGGAKTAGTTGGGGAGAGGQTLIRTTAAALNLGQVSLSTIGAGGTSSGTGVSGYGGSGTGGGARIDTPVGATGSITATGATTLNAVGTGGNATVTTGQTGGAGIGGTGTSATNFLRGAYVVNQGGTFTFNGLTLTSNAVGGTGAIGGAATGGLSQLTTFGGAISATGATSIAANATGGAALAAGNVGGGAGGAATAGQARASADYINFQSTVITQRVTLGATTINATAQGGAGATGFNGGAGGVGGAATGGLAQAFSNASTLGITTTSMNSDTRGFGGAGGSGGTTGVGGAGGAGTGGATGGIGFGTISGPNLPPNTGLATFGNTTILASGSGGAGGSGSTGGAGGLGTGGYTTLLSRGTPVTFGTLNFSGQGIGGSGGSGTVAQGQGGSAIGGGLSFATSNRFERTERGLLIAGNTLISVSGLAGPGAAGATSTAGWAGMTVTNGDVTFANFTYQSLGTLPSTVNVPQLTLDVAGGVFGATGSMTIDSTGNAVLSARDNGVISANLLTATIRGNVLPRPTDVPIGVPGTIAANGNLNLSADNISLQSQLVAGGTLSVDANQALLLNATAGGPVFINANDVTVGNIASANADVMIYPSEASATVHKVVAGTISTPNGNIVISSLGTVATGPLFAGESIGIESVGALTITGNAIANALGSAPNEASADGGMYLYSSDGAISTGNLTALFVQVQQGELDPDDFTPASTPAQLTVGAVQAERIVINGIGNVTTGALTVTNVYPFLALDPQEYPVALLFAGALGNLNVASATGTDFGLLAAGGSVTAGNLSFTGSLAVTAGQNATLGTVTTGTGTNDLFYAANTSVLFNDPLIAPHFLELLEFDTDNGPDVPFSPSLLLTSTLPAMGGALSVGNTTTGTVRAAAASATFNGINASQRVILTTTGLAAFNGLAISPRFDITSGDIAIGNAGGIGNASTSILNLIAASPLVTIGGLTVAQGYGLTDAEAGRLTAATTTITAQGPVTIRDLNLRGSSAQQPNLLGPQAAFRILSPAAIRVQGAVALTGAATTDTFVLSSNQRIEVPTDLGGSLTLNGLQTSSLGGTLSLAAPVIAVATNNIIAQMAQDPRYAGRDAALAAPAGNRPEGFLQASRIILTGHNVIAIQNSNTTALMGGFTSGLGGMNVIIPNQQQVGQPTDVNIYGRTTSATGAFVTNGNTLATVTRTPNNGSFSTTSAVNACLFTATTACAAPPTPPPVDPEIPPPTGPNNPGNPNEPVPISPAVVALVEEATDGDPVGAAAVPAIRIVRMLDETAIVEDAEVTDPVAGSANASVWDVGTEGDEDTAEEGDTDAAPATPGAGGGR